jgi:hypothetical protein
VTTLEIFAYVMLALAIIGLVALAISNWQNEGFRTFVTNQFPAVVGLPAAGLFTFLIVALFESKAGQIKFEVIGFKFEGASGPIVMWVFTFLAIVIAIKLVWQRA